MNIESIQAGVAPRAPLPESSARAAPATTQQRQAGTSDAAQQRANGQPDNATLQHAVQHLSDFVASFRPEINFSVDEASGVRVVKIIDTQSQAVIRQIPSEEAVHIAQALDKLQGLFVKESA